MVGEITRWVMYPKNLIGLKSELISEIHLNCSSFRLNKLFWINILLAKKNYKWRWQLFRFSLCLCFVCINFPMMGLPLTKSIAGTQAVTVLVLVAVLTVDVIRTWEALAIAQTWDQEFFLIVNAFMVSGF